MSEDDVSLIWQIAKPIWNWAKERFTGSIEITQPHNRDLIEYQPWVTVRGKSTKAKNKTFWLLTRRGFKYWPQTAVSIAPDGQWEGRVNVNVREETREHSIVLAEVNQFADSIFVYYKTHAGRIDWEPLVFKEDGKAFKVAHEIVFKVLGTASGGKTNR